ncbi:MAG: nitrate ABC transporter substrate-binding protein, partial [Pseudomonadota bacterium]
MNAFGFVFAASLAGLAAASAASAQGVGAPMREAVAAEIRDCRAGTDVAMPVIAWGADGVTLQANGGGFETAPGPLADAGWSLALSLQDAFAEQLEDYLSCGSPFLRGTLGMLVAAAPVTEADPRTEQVVIFKHSWSAGDGIVAAEGISNASDLAGKRIAVQAYGPHLDFVGRIVADAGLTLDDVE